MQFIRKGWSFIENLLSGFMHIPVKDSEDGVVEYDEYNSQMMVIRTFCMLLLALAMLNINKKTEFSALRYVSVGVLLCILFSIIVTIFLTVSGLLSKCPNFTNTTVLCKFTNSSGASKNQN